MTEQIINNLEDDPLTPESSSEEHSPDPTHKQIITSIVDKRLVEQRKALQESIQKELNSGASANKAD